MGVGTLRRHYRTKVLARKELGETATAMAYQDKLNRTGGTPLPITFVSEKARKALIDKGYITLDDLNGVTAEALIKATGLSKTDVGKVLAAANREIALRGDDQTALPDDYPYAEALIAAGYTTEESLAELDETELALIPDVGEVGAEAIGGHRSAQSQGE